MGNSNAKRGYIWYIEDYFIGEHMPIEEIFGSFDECKASIYPEYLSGYYGIDYVASDNGAITTIRNLVKPAKTWFFVMEMREYPSYDDEKKANFIRRLKSYLSNEIFDDVCDRLKVDKQLRG